MKNDGLIELKVWFKDTVEMVLDFTPSMTLRAYDYHFSKNGQCLITKKGDEISIWDTFYIKRNYSFSVMRGLLVQGVNLRNISDKSELTENLKYSLQEYGATLKEQLPHRKI